jgi:type III pantothenate kinase
VDALSDQGEFLGGLILPGLDLMRSSLATGTALPPHSGGRVQDFPRNTADAIHSGAVLATTGAIRQQYAKLPMASPCLLGGGAVAQLGDLLNDLPLLRVENLVLDGLQVLARGQAT